MNTGNVKILGELPGEKMDSYVLPPIILVEYALTEYTQSSDRRLK
jgi:hypothetical protein